MSKQKQTSKQKTSELQDKIDQLTEALQRERADAINIRNRHEGQIKDLKETVKTTVIRDLLPIVDNFERALSHVPKDLVGNEYIQGVEGIVKQFQKVLDDMGVKRIKTVGEHFDPNLHEAVSAEGEGDEEIVSEELQAGYTLGNEVIRHAMVKVKS